MSRAVLFLVLTSCVGTTPYVRKDLAKRSFRELTTAHVRLTTDLSEGKAREQVARLEELWNVLGDHYALVAPGTVRPLGVIEVIHLVSCHDYDAIAPRNSVGFASTTADHREQPLFVACGYDVDDQRGLLLHEMAHLFNGHYFPGLPVWLEEGLAEYYSTVRVEGAEVVIGLPNRRAMSFWGHRAPGPRLERLLAMTYDEFHDYGTQSAYFSAWKAVHLFNTRHHDRFVRLLDGIRRGESDADAWKAAFGDLRPAALEEEFAEYHLGTVINRWKSPYQPSVVTTPPQVRRLDVGEVYGVWIHLQLLAVRGGRGDPEGVRAELELAAKEAPGWPLLFFWQKVAEEHGPMRPGYDADRFAVFADAWSRTPDDYVASAAIVALAADSPRDESKLAAIAAAAKLVGQEPRTPRDLGAVAGYWARRGEHTRALELGRRALAMDQGCVPCLEALAVALSGLGHDAQADSFTRRAQRLMQRDFRRGR